MKNVKMKVDKKKLIIEIDLAKEFGKSKSGKNIIIASSEGNKSVDGADDGTYIGINVYKKEG